MKASLYRHFDNDNTLLYVGISVDFGRRTLQHFWGSPWMENVTKITIERYNEISQAGMAEVRAVLDENPIHNKIRFCSQDEIEKFIKNLEEKYPEKHPLVIKAMKKLGGPGDLCDALKISRQALHNWGSRLPELRKLQIEKILSEIPDDETKKFRLRRREKK